MVAVAKGQAAGAQAASATEESTDVIEASATEESAEVIEEATAATEAPEEAAGNGAVPGDGLIDLGLDETPPEAVEE